MTRGVNRVRYTNFCKNISRAEDKSKERKARLNRGYVRVEMQVATYKLLFVFCRRRYLRVLSSAAQYQDCRLLQFDPTSCGEVINIQVTFPGVLNQFAQPLRDNLTDL